MNRFYRKELLAQNRKETRRWFLVPQNIITGILPMVLSIVALWQTSVISSQQQKIQGFDTLLHYTNESNRLISFQLAKIDSQLAISQENQARSIAMNENASIGNMNKFSAAIYSLGEALSQYKNELGSNDEAHLNLLKQARAILESQMNNPYLVQNIEAMQKWTDGYRHVCFYNPNLVGFSSTFSEEFQKAQESRLSEISSNIKVDFESALKSINVAYKIGITYLRTDKNFMK